FPTITAKKKRSFPQWREQCDRMLKQQDGCHHNKWNKRRVRLSSKQFSRSPDNRHHSQCERSGHRSAQEPFKQTALHYAIGPRDTKEGDRVCHRNNQPGHKQVYEECCAPKQKRIVCRDVGTKQKVWIRTERRRGRAG